MLTFCDPVEFIMSTRQLGCAGLGSRRRLEMDISQWPHVTGVDKPDFAR